MINTCRTCFYCIPNYKNAGRFFHWGTCYYAKRKVRAIMSACQLYQERSKTVALKSTSEKRNTYKDKDGVIMAGYTLPEVLNAPLTILAKREYVWGKFDGMAVKAVGEKAIPFVIEVTAEIPIKALNNPQLPKMPFLGRFVQKTSKNGNDYYTVELITTNGEIVPIGESDEPLPF